MKTRIAIPAATKNKVLGEFNHRCAICGTERPQIHHIDENPSNNDPLNLIPLCPNCHLIDQHNPTRTIEPKKLMLFRTYKDPTILKPQFHPLFMRLQFLDEISDEWDLLALAKKVNELCDFVAALSMGDFYSKRLREILRAPGGNIIIHNGSASEMYEQAQRRKNREARYREKLRDARSQVYELISELLRYQPW